MAYVLIVDDEPLNAELASVVCSAAGHEVVTATDGLEALAAIARAHDEGRRFDLLLVDVRMPHMDGLALTRHLRADAGYRDVPIVGFTARAGAADLARCREAGMDEVLVKPFRHKEMRAVVAAHLARAASGGVVRIERIGDALGDAEARWGLEA